MIKILKKFLLKDGKDVMDSAVRTGFGTASGVIGILANLLLSASKVFVGLVFASLSILADGLNNLSDAGSSIISLLGFKLAVKKADKDHPFGHARFEYVAGLVIAFVIIFLGFQMSISSVEKILSGSEMEFSYVSVAVLGGSIVVKLWLAVFYKRVGKMINSKTVLAASTDSRNDLFVTASILATLLLFKFTGLQFDGFVSLAVAVYIICSGIKVAKDTISPLLGEVPDSELVQKITAKLENYSAVLGIHDLIVHNYGVNKIFASIHAEVDYLVNILDSHELIDQIEKDFLAEDIHLIIHMDPVVTNDESVTQMREKVLEILKKIDETWDLHDFRVVLGEKNQNLIFDVVVSFDCKKSDETVIDEICTVVNEFEKSWHCVITVDRDFGGRI